MKLLDKGTARDVRYGGGGCLTVARWPYEFRRCSTRQDLCGRAGLWLHVISRIGHGDDVKGVVTTDVMK